MFGRKKRGHSFIGSIISLALVVLSVLLVFLVGKLNVLQPKYLLIMIGLLVLIYLILAFKINSRRTGFIGRGFCYFIAIILIISYTIAIKYISTTINFMENLTNKTSEKQTYSVLVLNNSKYKEISNLDGKTIGFLNTNPNKEKCNEKLSKKAKITYKSKEESITDLIIGLNNKSLDAAVVDTSLINLIKEEQLKTIGNTRVIFTYTLYINKKSDNEKVDVRKDPFVFYISGSDSREKITDTDRSDVNIIAAVNPKTHKILLVNIPRDYYVQLHGTTGTKDKLTHAGLYGVDMSSKTLEDLFDIKINYYAKVGFTTLINSVDVMGGIDIDSPYAFTAITNKNCKFKVGPQHVNGDCALAFSRERKAFQAGDFTRGENQQRVIAAMIERLNDPKVLIKYDSILKSIDGSFETNMTYKEMTTLIKSQLTSFSSWKVESTAVGGTGTYDYTYSMGNQKLYVTIPNENEVEKAQDMINEILNEK